MIRDELIKHLSMGREIEFTHKLHPFFIGLSDQSQNDQIEYYIYDCTNQQTLVSGTIQDILSFEFQDQITLSKDIEAFQFQYIL